ncbi:hypothetical protein [Pedobacter sp. ASV12]|uniref:hypothetical protein n=1 Tax=Pedobacter sp. ASV12 TaxID=2795120 RepID=UPI0018ECAFAA|nr:hypothetical protein [Pedobacter sp. ASV12]
MYSPAFTLVCYIPALLSFKVLACLPSLQISQKCLLRYANALFASNSLALTVRSIPLWHEDASLSVRSVTLSTRNAPLLHADAPLRVHNVVLSTRNGPLSYADASLSVRNNVLTVCSVPKTSAN